MAGNEEVLKEDEQFGWLLARQRLIPAEQITECLKLQKDLAGQGIEPLPRLGEILMRKGYWAPPAGAPAPAPAAAASQSETRIRQMPPEARKALQDRANVVGKYIRTALAGKGAMGEVWKAWDTGLNRWAALKFLRGVDRKDFDRLRREAQTAARLHHPNIAPVYEIAEANGQGFIAMQFIDGQSLATLEVGDRRRAAEIVRDAALALEFAHAQGIVHRDVKPGNIMVDSAGRTFVMDFGLARQADLEQSATGKALGTPSYMPPEQALGRKIEQPQRSDIYSLGATLYFLLTRRAPFEGRSAVEIVRAVIKDPVVPPSRHNKQVPPELEKVVLRAMAKEPARRYASCRELADDLARTGHAHSLPEDERLQAQASSALHEGHLEEALQAYRSLFRLLKGGPEEELDAFLHGLLEEESGLGLALKHKKDNFELRTQRGLQRLTMAILTQVQGGDPTSHCRSALEDFDAAVALKPQDAGARLKRTCVMLFLSRYSPDRTRDGAVFLANAIRDLDEALKADPACAPALHNRGVARMALAHLSRKDGEAAHRQAVEDLSRACQLDPDYAYTFKDLGAAKMGLARALQPKGHPVKPLYAEAAAHLEVACRLDGANAGAWHKRGQALYSLQRFETAIECLEKAAELEPVREKDVLPMIEEAHRRLDDAPR